jgi:hypothetical protein
VPNLPTVWSNCLAGWWLGGGGNWHKLIPLIFGATLCYLGGMFLNDAFDAEFDALNRRAKPIPSGSVNLQTVWRIGAGLLGAGALCLILCGPMTGVLTLLLVVCIMFYNAIHKFITASQVLMAASRFLLYLIAASTASQGVTGESVWCGFALAAYVIGLGWYARNNYPRAEPNYWPAALMAVPVLMAWLLDAGRYREPALLLSAILALWAIRSMRFEFWTAERNPARMVSSLLAGIPLVDLLASANSAPPFGFLFVLLFGAAILLQQLIPDA